MKVRVENGLPILEIPLPSRFVFALYKDYCLVQKIFSYTCVCLSLNSPVGFPIVINPNVCVIEDLI